MNYLSTVPYADYAGFSFEIIRGNSHLRRSGMVDCPVQYRALSDYQQELPVTS